MTLKEWHAERKAHPRTLNLDYHKLCDTLTLITYIYGTAKYVGDHFYQIDNAIKETWYWFGMLKTVIVTNVETKEISDFAALFNDWVRVEMCDGLIPGDLYEYSRDCIANLHTRFDTPYMLFIHPDGFPLRSGIEEFVGNHDYIGAPWVGRDDILGKLLLSQRNFVGNGGFSLRTHEICEAASALYKRHWKWMPNIFTLYEDYFFCRVLPKFEPTYRRRFNFAPREMAERFALEQFEESPGELPLGFHSAAAFEKLTKLT